ncbi:MAG: GntR family transcriptional regulator [Candidatus Sulfotelmatobacter sp.]
MSGIEILNLCNIRFCDTVNAMSFRKLKFKGVFEETYDALKSKILSGELAPGARVDVLTVSEELGVSRTPVNDALQVLKLQGLIEIVPRKGTFVAQVTPKDVEDAFQLRMALEGKACELASGDMDASKTSSLRTLNDLLAHDSHPVLSEHIRINQKFHELIVGYSNNPMLLKSYLEVQARMQFLQVYFGFESWQKRSPEIVDEHNAIIEALASHDPNAAQRLMNGHIRSAMARLIAVIRAPKEAKPVSQGQKTAQDHDVQVHS